MEKEEKLKLRKQLPEKEFKIRDSAFTVLFKDKNVQSFRNFIFGYFIVFAISNAFNDLYYDGGSMFGFRLIILAFSKIHFAIFGWFILFSLHVLFYFGFNLWKKFKSISIVWDILWAVTCFCGFFGTFHFTAIYCLQYELPIATRCIILGEQVRFIMKGYAFLRTNMLHSKQLKNNYKTPSIYQYLYFSFAPTLIYRNEYPRSKDRSWMKVFKYFFEVFFYIYCIALIENEYFIKPLENFGKEPFGKMDIFYIFLKYSLPACVNITLFIPFCVLHSFQNAFAEMLKFGDREFFTDWWNLTNISHFHQKWNAIVQGWLYTYVYREFYENLFPLNKTIAKVAVFTLSIIIHEVMFFYATQLCLPIFLFSMLLAAASSSNSNLSVLLFILTGNSFLYTLPHLEYFAKANCPNPPTEFIYLPRLLSCD